MYLQHFGLSEAPFSITPDPRFVYLSERHREGLAHLLYGFGQGGSGGFVLLTGEVGTGKTTLCRLSLEQLPAQTEVALLLNPSLNPSELLESIAEELKLDLQARRGSVKQLTDLLSSYLLEAHAAGRRVVVLLDEAQNLSHAALEQVRLLTNLETPTQKLLQVILLGQPELLQMLERVDLRQLAQRITARYHLTPLDVKESAGYLAHRLSVAGASRELFSAAAKARLHHLSGGIPRLLNILADRALLAGYARGHHTVGWRLVGAAAREVLPAARRTGFFWWRTVLVVGLILGLALSVHFWRARPAVEPLALPTSSAVVTSVGETPTLPAWLGLLERYRLSPELLTRVQRCPEVLVEDVHCLKAEGDPALLRALRMPVLLETSDGPALLIGLEAEHFLLEGSGHVQRLDATQLGARWSGSYCALWRHPAEVPLVFGRAYSGPGVQLLAERMAKLDGGSPQARRYGPAFAERVANLQKRFGRKADGVVGPETWLLSLVGAEQTPALHE